MLLAIGTLTLLVVLFALLAVTPLLPEVAPDDVTLAESLLQQPLVAFPTDHAQAA